LLFENIKSKEGNGLMSLPMGIGATAPVSPGEEILLGAGGAVGRLSSMWVEEVSIIFT